MYKDYLYKFIFICLHIYIYIIGSSVSLPNKWAFLYKVTTIIRASEVALGVEQYKGQFLVHECY